MTIKNRTAEEQERFSSHMRRNDVLESILLESLHAEPASQEEVKWFLATAPPEVFVLLDGLLPLPLPTGLRDESLHENRTVQGFVGAAMARRKRMVCCLEQDRP
ncbi:hypothetical protein [Arthrobacter sp. KNU40]|uniref:hypothetical protein n=1 Tax=Arthrobacter sp. KNU40 TaxID=3447965 RepID=UPI003F5E28CA